MISLPFLPSFLLGAAFIIILFIVFYFVTHPSYCDGWNPMKSEGLLKMEAVQGFTFQQMMELFNLISDLRKEIKKPPFFRFWKYPYTEERELLFQYIYTVFASRLEALEECEKMGELKAYGS